jgi:hypothetical protein
LFNWVDLSQKGFFDDEEDTEVSAPVEEKKEEAPVAAPVVAAPAAPAPAKAAAFVDCGPSSLLTSLD